jgi:hypothetical protein
MHLGAQVSYGIAVPDYEGWPEHDEFPWWTQAAEDEHGDHETAAEAYLKAANIEGVSLDSYGHMGYSENGLYIRTAQLRVYAYNVRRLTHAELSVDPGHAPRLENAWHQLFGDLAHEPPAWIVTLTYG